MKLLCKIGLHNWYEYVLEKRIYRRCVRCRKHQELLYNMVDASWVDIKEVK